MLADTFTSGGARLRAWFHSGGWVGVWQVVYLATLIGATVAAIGDGDTSIPRRVAIGVVAAPAAGWYVLISTRWRYWEAPSRRYVVLLGVAAALWFPLLVLHEAFGWTVFAAYGVAACPWLRRSLPGIAVLTALIVVADVLDGAPRVTLGRVLTLIVVAAFVVLLHATTAAIAAESERRKRLINELESTRAELAASERAAGASAERERLARDVHDAIAQGFTSIVMLLEATSAQLPDGSDTARAALDQALQAARDGLAESRRVVWALRPGDREPGALVASLERLAERTAAAGDVDVDVVVTGEPSPLDAGCELTLLRAAQEAVTNALRHAGAAQITVTVSWLGDTVILDVADDGRGFEPRRVAPRGDSGFGLTSLGERARERGGTLTVESTPAEGTTVSLALPVHARLAGVR